MTVDIGLQGGPPDDKAAADGLNTTEGISSGLDDVNKTAASPTEVIGSAAPLSSLDINWSLLDERNGSVTTVALALPTGDNNGSKDLILDISGDMVLSEVARTMNTGFVGATTAPPAAPFCPHLDSGLLACPVV